MIVYKSSEKIQVIRGIFHGVPLESVTGQYVVYNIGFRWFRIPSLYRQVHKQT